MKRVVITGGTGLIGKRLVELLSEKYEVIVLTRKPDHYTDSLFLKYAGWDGITPVPDIVNGAYAVINLAGENIGNRRWTEKQKGIISTSRTNAAEAIAQSIRVAEVKPEIWIQASATGYYRHSHNLALTETAPHEYSGFLSTLCEQWEFPAQNLDLPEVRTVIIRSGVVLTYEGGIWPQLTAPLNFGCMVIPGNGEQYLSWIHIRDEIRAIAFLLSKPDSSGIYNLTAPEPCTIQYLMKTAGLNRKYLFSFHVPAWILKIVLGKEKTEELILADQYIIPDHLKIEGFEFIYKTIEDASRALTKRPGLARK